MDVKTKRLLLYRKKYIELMQSKNLGFQDAEDMIFKQFKEEQRISIEIERINSLFDQDMELYFTYEEMFRDVIILSKLGHTEFKKLLKRKIVDLDILLGLDVHLYSGLDDTESTDLLETKFSEIKGSFRSIDELIYKFRKGR